MFENSPTPPIGLDIGHASVRMIQLQQMGKSLSVRAAAQAALPRGEGAPFPARAASAMALARQLLRRGSFHGRRIVMSVPREALCVHHLRLPQMPEDGLEAAVQAEAKGLLPFDPTAGQLRFIPAGQVRQGGEIFQEVILFAARDTDIASFIHAVSKAGFILDSLDVEACAAYRAIDRFVRRRDDEREVHVIVDVGLEESRVVIGVGRLMKFVRSIPIGGMHFQEAVSRELGISLDEADALRRRLKTSNTASDDEDGCVRGAAHNATRGIIEELTHQIARCLRYYAVTFRGPGPSKLRLIGGEANDPQLLAMLGRMITIPAEVARPLLSIDASRMRPEDRTDAAAEWGAALGLAFKGMPGPFGPRDGKPRDKSTARPPSVVAEPELVHA